ncbi:MAG TPA: alanine dehydrogenase [Bacteroides sp.]|nr:alanine dehydrogenase [Bacteroides sp.]
MKIGIIRETKNPPDRRVPFSPGQVAELQSRFPDHEFVVESSDLRCFTDKEYSDAGVRILKPQAGAGEGREQDESGSAIRGIGDCEVLFGVKEVELDELIPGKTYVFFSHTAKEQPYNRKLLQEIVKLNISLVDYEYLTDTDGIRVVAFGRWAGIVGAYNGLRAYGERYRQFRLKPAHQCHDMEEMKQELKKVVEVLPEIPPIKILITGGGRVAFGAMETLGELGLETIPPEQFLKDEFDKPAVCRIDPWDYVRRTDGEAFELGHFFKHPGRYTSTFKPFTKVSDVFIPCHFWDPDSPAFMSPSDMREPDFHIRVIADVSCDIKDPIPSTLRASTIAEPFYGYDPLSETETPPFDLRSITVMAVDNLPGELPRDASVDFGSILMEKVVPVLLSVDADGVIDRATITRGGALTKHFEYLMDYLGGS